MKRAASMGLCAGLVWLASAVQPAQAQNACAADCNAYQIVAINELILCVNIVLGSSDLSACDACDVDNSGTVGINEIIAGVNAAANGCQQTGGVICGDGTMEEDETCDDGNNIGGDGCAANCTTEIRRETTLDPTRSKATVQLAAIPITLPISGTQALISGRPRNVVTIGKNHQQLFAAQQFPVVVKATDVKFNKISLAGLFCACVRADPVPEYGEGISGVGSVACGSEGLTDIDFLVRQDHDTTPGDPNNSGTAEGLPDDPECDDVFDAGGGIRTTACLEGTGEACSRPENEHTGICESPRVYTFSGGPAPRGSVLLRNSTAIGLLRDQGRCAEAHNPNGTCATADYGPDCLPCTDDDLEQGIPSIGPTTTGTAAVLIYDSGPEAGRQLGDGAECGSLPCLARVTGEVTDCDALIANPDSPLTGTLVTAFPGLDSGSGDTAATTTLAAQH